MKRNLIKKLILPLSVATIASLILAYFFPLQGLFVNLATTFIGILLTVFYVDLILRDHEKQQWSKVQYIVNEQITRFANHAISQFRSAFHYGTKIINMSVFDSNDPRLTRKEMARIAENILIPAVENGVEQMNHKDWKALSQNLNLLVQTANQLITLYGDKIEPDIFSLIVEIQGEADSILAGYFAFPDIYGVPDEQLPVPTKGSAVEHKRDLNEIATNHAQELLLHASTLLKKL